MKLSHTRIWLGIVSTVLVLESGALLFSSFGGNRSALTATTALLGALAGAAGAIGGQVVAAHLQVKRDAAAASRAAAESVRDTVLDANRQLLSDLVALRRDIQSAEPTVMERFDHTRWRSRWPVIWTKDRSLNIAAGALLIADDKARLQIDRVVNLLDNSANLTDGTDTAHAVPLYETTVFLADMGVEAMSRYLRRDPASEDGEGDMKLLEDRLASYNEWIEEKVKAAENEQRIYEATRAEDGTDAM